MLNTYDKLTLFQYFGQNIFLKKAFGRNIEIELIYHM